MQVRALDLLFYAFYQNQSHFWATGIGLFVRQSRDYRACGSPFTIGWEASNPKLFGAISIRAMTMAIEAIIMAVLATSFTTVS